MFTLREISLSIQLDEDLPEGKWVLAGELALFLRVHPDTLRNFYLANDPELVEPSKS